MAGVIIKADSTKDIVQGAAIVFVNKLGAYKDLNPVITKPVSLTAVSGLLIDRFNDTQYYTA